jgi:uncharacterized NAD-dependent epimerase/dehydratase family protein
MSGPLEPHHELALYMEGAFENGTGKMGLGVLRYSSNPIACVIDSRHVGEDLAALTGIPCSAPIVASVPEAIALGADVLVLGIAPPGGLIPAAWTPALDQAIAGGLSLLNGLHDLLGPRYPSLGPDQWIWDVRIEPPGLVPGTGAARTLANTRILTIGTDMAIGKMTAGLELYRALLTAGQTAAFVATGQIGITLTGRGVPLDAIRLDFASGSIEREVMAAAAADYVIIEGQGSLLHPASTATLPLLRGSMPTHLLMCHRARMTHLSRVPWVAVPPLQDFFGLYQDLAAAQGGFPRPVPLGICLNTSGLTDSEARAELDQLEQETALPCVDPVRFGVQPLVAALVEEPQRTQGGQPRSGRGAWLGLVLAVLSTLPFALAAAAQEPPDTNYDEGQVGAYELPDPLVCFDGRTVADATAWREIRRPEIVAAFAEHVFGKTPAIATHLRSEPLAPDAEVFGGTATRKQVRLRLLDAADAPWIDLLMYVPRVANGRPPVFLGLNYGNQGVEADESIVPSRNAVCGRGEHASRWPLQMILERGYAVACFHGGDIELDRHGSGCRFTTEGWQQGIRHFVMRQNRRTEPAADEWGSIGAWAWGLSRVLDYLQTDPAVDGDRVTVFGHSRTGKTALWAGAQDERFAAVISNNSGQGGAALARRRYGETVAASFTLSGIWYCRNYRQYGGREAELPIDAHLLIAALAPRPVYVASAEQDRWADPRGEFLAALHAEPVYRLFGLAGLGVDDMPAVNHPVGKTIGYHIRSGDHDITRYDWDRFLDFVDQHQPR